MKAVDFRRGRREPTLPWATGVPPTGTLGAGCGETPPSFTSHGDAQGVDRVLRLLCDGDVEMQFRMPFL